MICFRFSFETDIAIKEAYSEDYILVYKKAFADNRKLIESCFPVYDSVLDLKQRGIINEECRFRVVSADVMSKGSVLVDYLLEQNDINVFKKFMELCEIKQSNLAKQLKLAINTALKESGFASKHDDFVALRKSMSGKLTLHFLQTNIYTYMFV